MVCTFPNTDHMMIPQGIVFVTRARVPQMMKRQNENAPESILGSVSGKQTVRANEVFIDGFVATWS